MKSFRSESEIKPTLPIEFRVEHNAERGGLYLYYGAAGTGFEQGVPVTVAQLEKLLAEARAS